MIAPLARRGFLRGLTALPLIGGGVTLIGQPTAVAEPVTDALRERYFAWLAREFREAWVEHETVATERHVARSFLRGQPSRPGYVQEYAEQVRHRTRMLTDLQFIAPFLPPVPTTPPSTRAALVLATVGHDWRQDPEETR